MIYRNRKVVSLEEPVMPKSKYAITGLYSYGSNICRFAKELSPLVRSELKITKLNKIYLEYNLLNVEILGCGFIWLDTGTHDSMLQASNFIQVMELDKGEKIACIEEIILNHNYISEIIQERKIEQEVLV